MNKVEHVANEIVRGLKVQSGIDLEPDDALTVARIVISVLKGAPKTSSELLSPWHKFKTSTKLGEEVAIRDWALA